MQIALNDVLKDDGKILRVDADFGSDTFEMKLGKYPITRKTPVSLVLTNKGKRNLLIQGRMDLTILIPCGRCLEEVPVEFELDFEKKIDMNLTEEERREALDECAYIHGYDLDVDELVYSEILVNWPLRVLCKEDCKGLCPHCGADRNVTDCDCDKKQIDPRFAALRALLDSDKGE